MTSTISVTTGNIGSSSDKLPMPRPAQNIRGSWVVNVDARLKIAAVHLAILISSKILPARTAKKRKRRLIGTEAPMTPTTLTSSRSTLPLAGSQTPTDQGDQHSSKNRYREVKWRGRP